MSDKRSSSDRSQNPLPGFEFTVAAARPGDVDMSDEKRFTGEVLFRDHPDVFKAVAAAFFIDGLSIRSTAARYRVSVNTVRAIRDMALESGTSDANRAAFFIKSKADRLHGIIKNRALEVIYDRLCDPEQSSEISVDTLIKLAEIEQKSDAQRSPASSEIIDVDEFDDMLNVLNGLDGDKKSPDDLGSDSAADDGCRADDDGGRADDGAGRSDPDDDDLGDSMPADCSTGNRSGVCRSFELSGDTQCLHGCGETLCKSLCKCGGDLIGSGESCHLPGGFVSDVQDAASELEMAPGGGGSTGAAARGGSD